MKYEVELPAYWTKASNVKNLKKNAEYWVWWHLPALELSKWKQTVPITKVNKRKQEMFLRISIDKIKHYDH